MRMQYVFYISETEHYLIFFQKKWIYAYALFNGIILPQQPFPEW